MKLSQSEQALISGDDDALEEFVSGDECCVIDWREEWDEIVDVFNSFLTEDFVQLGVDVDVDDDVEEIDFDDIKGVIVSTKNGEATVSTEEMPIGLEIAEAIASILTPDYEAHLFKDFEGDTAVYLVRSGQWWNEFRSEYPDQFKTLFQ